MGIGLVGLLGRKCEKVRELEDVLRQWALDPPPLANDGAPGYKP